MKFPSESAKPVDGGGGASSHRLLATVQYIPGVGPVCRAPAGMVEQVAVPHSQVVPRFEIVPSVLLHGALCAVYTTRKRRSSISIL